MYRGIGMVGVVSTYAITMELGELDPKKGLEEKVLVKAVMDRFEAPYLDTLNMISKSVFYGDLVKKGDRYYFCED